MPISVISVASRSRLRGSLSCCPRSDHLFRAGRAGLSRSRSHRESVLSACARGVDAAHGRAGHRGDCDRKPIGDHWRRFALRQAIHSVLPRLAILYTSERIPGRFTFPASTRRSSLAFCCWSGSSARRARWHRPMASRSLPLWSPTACSVSSSSGKWWRWPLWGAVPLVIPFVVVDAAFLSANLLEVLEGAWVPLLFGISMVLLIMTWRRGTESWQ